MQLIMVAIGMNRTGRAAVNIVRTAIVMTETTREVIIDMNKNNTEMTTKAGRLTLSSGRTFSLKRIVRSMALFAAFVALAFFLASCARPGYGGYGGYGGHGGHHYFNDGYGPDYHMNADDMDAAHYGRYRYESNRSGRSQYRQDGHRYDRNDQRGNYRYEQKQYRNDHEGR
jgi:hypothetical protein